MNEYEEYDLIARKVRGSNEYILFVEQEDYAEDIFLRQEKKTSYFVCISSTKHFNVKSVIEVIEKTKLTKDVKKILEDYQETKMLFDSMI
ncbi:hypothetical protein CSR02_14050 [Acetobacter pomorum]|uniref:Uncharacterized protein n=1 Tax=Acetobacter pomorum TaxID=65959 RepID=A0A2G4R8M6_9PROT|nr:hypothetical protein [Acetobacter pomorum]PHY92926.1 hypothetical protein CSR02_14050 [Acetobacter pomorum]GBR53446.1 hypothetical protein AA11825_2473 [Acetobacter pomorum DSM 11825]